MFIYVFIRIVEHCWVDRKQREANTQGALDAYRYHWGTQTARTHNSVLYLAPPFPELASPIFILPEA